MIVTEHLKSEIEYFLMAFQIIIKINHKKAHIDKKQEISIDEFCWERERKGSTYHLSSNKQKQ